MKRGYVVTYTYDDATKKYYTGFDWVYDPLKAKVYKTGVEALKVIDTLRSIWVGHGPYFNIDVQTITKTVVKPKPVKTFHRIKHNRFAR